MAFTFLSAMDAIPSTGVAGFDLDIGNETLALLVLREGDEVRVFHNVCPHAGRRLEVAPGRFIVDSGSVICSAHGACFSIPDGCCTAGPCRAESLRELRSEVRGGEIWFEPQ